MAVFASMQLDNTADGGNRVSVSRRSTGEDCDYTTVALTVVDAIRAADTPRGALQVAMIVDWAAESDLLTPFPGVEADVDAMCDAARRVIEFWDKHDAALLGDAVPGD